MIYISEHLLPFAGGVHNVKGKFHSVWKTLKTTLSEIYKDLKSARFRCPLWRKTIQAPRSFLHFYSGWHSLPGALLARRQALNFFVASCRSGRDTRMIGSLIRLWNNLLFCQLWQLIKKQNSSSLDLNIMTIFIIDEGLFENSLALFHMVFWSSLILNEGDPHS